MIASKNMERAEIARDIVKGLFYVYKHIWEACGFELRLMNADVPVNSEIWTGTVCVSWYDEEMSSQVDGCEQVSFHVGEFSEPRSKEEISDLVVARLRQAYLCAVVKACQGILKTTWAKTIIKDRKKVKV